MHRTRLKSAKPRIQPRKPPLELQLGTVSDQVRTHDDTLMRSSESAPRVMTRGNESNDIALQRDGVVIYSSNGFFFFVLLAAYIHRFNRRYER